MCASHSTSKAMDGRWSCARGKAQLDAGREFVQERIGAGMRRPMEAENCHVRCRCRSVAVLCLAPLCGHRGAAERM